VRPAPVPVAAGPYAPPVKRHSVTGRSRPRRLPLRRAEALRTSRHTD
jgi:hypothetical protein